MKKLISIICALSLLICATLGTSVIAFADDISYQYNEDTAVLTVTGSGQMTNFTESTLKSRPWHVYSEETRTVVIEDGIESIGDFAFARFSELVNVVIPDSVTYIGNTAFGGNAKLREITVPDSVTQIEPYAFGYDYQMNIPTDFVTHCSLQSTAQTYCIENAVPFDVQMQGNTAEAHITKAGEQVMWSFVAPVDGTLEFNSVGNKDTFGLIYDAATYSYTTDFNEMKSIAVAWDDDSYDSNINFKVSCKVEAGKRYYLSARFISNSKYDGSVNENGKFTVYSSFTCTEHSYVRTSTVEPTCTQNGSATEKCEYCGDERTVELDATGHTPSDAVIEDFVDSTCTSQGSYFEVVYCSKCNEELSRTSHVVEKKAHSFTNYEITTPATCTTNAVETAKCDNCDATDSREVENSALGHNYVQTVVAPTCTEKGYTHYECSRCGESYNDNYVDMIAHTPGEEEHTNVVEPTCTQSGSYIGVVKCTVCGEVLEQNEHIIEPLGHNLVVKSFDGKDVHAECDRCDYVKVFTFADRFNTAVTDDEEWSVIDMNHDGFINAKDYVYLLKMQII